MKIKWGLLAIGILFVVGILILYLFLTPRKTNWQNAAVGIPLVRYYTSVCGTDGYDSHYELILKKTDSPDELLLEEREGDNETETLKQYTVPMEAAEGCFAVIDCKNLKRWNKRYADNPVCGVSTVCEFYDGEKTVRVSLDRMPRDGQQILNNIQSVLKSYITE